jgi:hypothetical protein
MTTAALTGDQILPGTGSFDNILFMVIVFCGGNYIPGQIGSSQFLNEQSPVTTIAQNEQNFGRDCERHLANYCTVYLADTSTFCELYQ